MEFKNATYAEAREIALQLINQHCTSYTILRQQQSMIKIKCAGCSFVLTLRQRQSDYYVAKTSNFIHSNICSFQKQPTNLRVQENQNVKLREFIIENLQKMNLDQNFEAKMKEFLLSEERIKNVALNKRNQM
ncbi:Hypothetical_protein [Hexamita inflata]|uniref:Hypothetical_protein n=1 Tax=Hexamita inflata TaxID=28002 RepID=A0AA86PWC4_9EUKA|nr:Hypothetical protein HINF_LOCUS34881 [Hexamita inflata]